MILKKTQKLYAIREIQKTIHLSPLLVNKSNDVQNFLRKKMENTNKVEPTKFRHPLTNLVKRWIWKVGKQDKQKVPRLKGIQKTPYKVSHTTIE